MKRCKKLLSLILALCICFTVFSQITLTASAASYSTASMQALANYVRTYGAEDSDGLGKILINKTISGEYDFYFVLQDRAEGLYFALLTSSDESNRVVSNTEFVLKESSSTISVDFAHLYYYDNQCLDAVSTTKSISKSAYSNSNTYSVSGSGKYITSAYFSETFHATLRLLFSHWDQYIYSRLGFGFKAMGFTSFNGYGSTSVCTSHTYTNSCDTTCNNCGATRSISHTYSGSCDSTCNICGTTRTTSGSHTYSSNSDKTCNTCGYERTTIIEDTSATVASGTCGSNVNWRVTKNGTLVISGTGTMYGYSGYGTQPWFDYRSQIKKVQILSGVTSIGNYAFYYHSNLENVEIADTVKTLGENCFGSCSLLREITIPYGVKAIPKFAFARCSSLQYANIPSTVTSFGQDCFDGCSSLIYFIIPDGTTSIAYYMFAGCTSLEYVQIPSSVKEIESGAFYNCYNLSDVYYTGTPSQLNAVIFRTGNGCVTSARIHYEAKAPCITCTYGGWTKLNDSTHQRACTNCGNAQTANHSWNAGTVTKQPNCSETGVKTYTCSICNGTKTETIAKTTDHVYGNWTMANDTTHQHSCTKCGKTETANHSWNAGTVTKQPNCSETGVKTYTCSICNGTKTETIAKTTDHVYGNWTKLDDTKHQHSCTKCGSAQTANHSWNAGTVTKQPNCSETGVKTYTCSICNGTKTETIAKTTDHVYGNWIKVNDNSHTHSCTLCGKTETVAHEWDSGKITVTPTLETTGIRVRSCKGCDATKTEVVPKRANGDLNGDQSIDNKDVEYLLWHTLFPDSYPLEIFADFDNNNVIDNKDVEYLLWHTLFPDSYPLYSK